MTDKVGRQWRYCPTERNLADLGSRGASLSETKEDWPPQLSIKSLKRKRGHRRILRLTRERKPKPKPKPGDKEKAILKTKRQIDEWDELLSRSTYWRVLRITAWALRFKTNSLAKLKRIKKKSGPLCTEKLAEAKQHWVEKVQRGISDDLERPGWRLVKDKETNLLKGSERIQGYNPAYLEDGPFTQKRIQHVHAQIKHLGVANTMAALREEWWIPRLRTRVKKEIRNCNVCKVFTIKPYGASTTSVLPAFRTEVSRPFHYVDVDFSEPLKSKASKTKEEKAEVLIFTCATSRAVHLELTGTQTA